MKPQLLTLAAILASAPGLFAGSSASTPPMLAPPTAAPQDDWSFELSPYIWAAWLTSDSNLPWDGPGLPSSAQRLDRKITGAFMLEGKARYHSFGVFGEFNWLQMDTETRRSGPLYSGAKVKTDYIYSKAGFSYELPLEGAFHMDLLAGASLWNISEDFELKAGILPGYTSKDSATAVRPLVGTDLSYDLSAQWQLLARGTVSGDANSNTQWDLYAGVGYQFNCWCVGTLGYRYLSEKFDEHRITVDTTLQGPQLGVTFKF